MDYDDNEFNIHNVELAEEGSSTVSPVLRPYDFEDVGNLRFDSLVENEVFLGITGQEDNQWIEEYSRGTSSSAAESRRDNVWSEATSSESVEMLLKSVGQGPLVTESSDEPGRLATNVDPNLKQEVENNHAPEAMVTNKEEGGALATEELDTSDEPDSLSINMDPNLKQDDENNHAQEAMVTNKEEEGSLPIDELVVTDEPGSLSANRYLKLKQDDENNYAQEAIVTNKEEDGALEIKGLDVSNQLGSLATYMDPNLKQDDEYNCAQEAMVSHKEGEWVLATKELNVSDEVGSLAHHSLKQDDENNYAQKAKVTNKEEEGALATEELDVSDEPGSLSINTDPNLKQDDENDHVREAMVTTKEEGALATKELNVSDEPGSLSMNMDPNPEQDDENNQNDENNFAREAMVTNKEEEGALATEELDVSYEPSSLSINMEPTLKQDDENNYSQEAMVIKKDEEEALAEELDVSDEPNSLSIDMDPNLKQNDGNNHAQEATVTNKEVGALVTEELAVSDDPGGELDSDVLGNKCDLSEEKVDGICDDEIPKGRNIANGLSENKLQDLSTPKIKCVNLDASKECNLKDYPSSNEAECSTKNSENLIGSHTAVESCTNSDGNPSNVESIDKPAIEVDIAVDEESMPAGSCNLMMAVSHDSKCAVTAFSEAHELNDDLMHEGLLPVAVEDDGKTKSEKLASPESNVCSPSKLDVESYYVEESEKADSVFGPSEMVRGSSIDDNDTDMKNTCSSVELLAGNKDLVTSPEALSGNSNDKDQNPAFKLSGSVQQQVNDEIQSSEQDGGTCIDHLVAFHEEGNARLPSNMDIAAPDRQKNVESISSEENFKAHRSEAVISILAEPGYIDDMDTNMKNKSSSVELLAGNNDLVATSKAHSGNSNDRDQSLAANLSGSVQQEQVTDDIHSSEQDGAKCIDHVDTFHGERNARLPLETGIAALDSPNNVDSVLSAEGCKAQGSEADTILAEPGYIDAKSSPIYKGKSSAHQDNEEKKEEGFASDGTCENKSLKSASSMVDCASLSVVETDASPDNAGEVVNVMSVGNMNELAQESNRDGLVGCSTPSTVDPILCDSSAKVGDNIEAGDGIQESISAHHVDMSSEQHASTDVVLTSECDDSHTRHEEDSSFPMDKSLSLSPLVNTDNSELSERTRVKPSEFAINENASLPEATKDVALASEFDDSHTRHEEDSSAPADKPQSVSPLLETANSELSESSRVKASEFAIHENPSLPGATKDVVLTSECDDSHTRHEEDSSVSMGKPQSVSPLLNTNNVELSESARVKPGEGAINENTSLLEATQEVQEEEKLVSLNSDVKIDNSFTFEVNATARLGETGMGLQLFPASQACSLSTNVEVPCIDSSSITLDPRKPDEAPIVTPETPGSATIHAVAKERKTRRKSVGKESVMKGKETTPMQSGRVEKSSPLLVGPSPPTAAAASGHVIQFQELSPKERVERSATKPVPISNLPDLNNATCMFHQPFTNNQQVQLRAQILVYGSLISGTSPEEPHMIAAFGQSDAGRKTWEAAWHACVERVHGQKSQANTPAMQQSRLDLKDLVHRTPDLGIKHSSIFSSSNMGTPPAVSPLISVSSPLWNMSTPSGVGLQSRSAAFQQLFTPIHPPSYQTPPNPLWLSQGPFLGPWGVASSSFSATPQFSGLPITEAVKLTPVKVSGGGVHTYSMPVVDSTVVPSLSTDGKKASVDSKSRKRKKVTAAFSSAPSQVLMTPAHLVPRSGGHNHSCFPFLVDNQTDLVTAPIDTSVFSTSVTVSTPASKSSSPGRILSVHDHPRLGNKKAGNAEDMLLTKAEEGNVQEDVNATKTWSRSTKRTKVTTSPVVNHTPVLTSAPAATYLPRVLGSEISLLTQNQSVAVNAHVFGASLPTSVAMSTPVSITSDSNPTGRFLDTIYPTASTHGYSGTGYQNTENALAVEETSSKVKESKLQAESAALLAAAEVSNCQDVWSGLDIQKNYGVVSDAEAKLTSSIAAAATVAKMASAAAKIASTVAEQAKLMADEVFLSSKTETYNHTSHPHVVNKATPASILKSVDKTSDNHSNSIISAAREAARRRIEAASAASKHAENLDAIIKAAELAAEAVSQVGKIVAMGDSSALRKLAEAGPEGFWKISELAGEVSGLHPNSNSGKGNVLNVFTEEIQTMKHGLAPLVHLAHNQMMMGIDDGSAADSQNDVRTTKVSKLSKSVGVSTETSTGSPRTYVVEHSIPQNTPTIWEEHNIKEGCLVEVYRENGKYKGAWLAANVLSLKDDKALVYYTGIQSSDEGSEKVEEWVTFEVGHEVVPRIRAAHPMTTMLFEGARKRRRTAVTDYAWSEGDKVDVWMQNCWREGVVMEPNKIDITSLTVQFPAQGETSVVRSWHVRPQLIWKDKKWIEWNAVRASQGESPKEKRMKLGSPAAVNDKRKDKLPMNVEAGKLEEQATQPPLLSAQETRFNVGKNTNKHSTNLRTIQKDGARVVFGVPKPGKKQKFMAVSTQYVDDRTKNNNITHGSFKHSKPLGARVSKTDATENQVTETRTRLKSRKPPVPSFRTTTSRNSQPTDADSVETSSSQNHTQAGSSSSKSRDPAKGPTSRKAFTFTSKPRSEHFNRGKQQLAPKADVKDKSNSQDNEPRRSNRKIQPTSRLLEGLQSSLTISKIPSVAHAGQRKVTPKGNSNHG